MFACGQVTASCKLAVLCGRVAQVSRHTPCWLCAVLPGADAKLAPCCAACTSTLPGSSLESYLQAGHSMSPKQLPQQPSVVRLGLSQQPLGPPEQDLDICLAGPERQLPKGVIQHAAHIAGKVLVRRQQAPPHVIDELHGGQGRTSGRATNRCQDARQCSLAESRDCIAPGLATNRATGAVAWHSAADCMAQNSTPPHSGQGRRKTDGHAVCSTLPDT